TKATSSGTTVKLKLTGVQSIASGTISSCSVLSNGSVSCWGPTVKSARGWAMGTPCSGDGDCSSGACLGGLCCTAACPSTDQSCAATACDSSGACVYPDPTTTCGASSCTGSTLTSGACDSAGTCLVGSTPCEGQLAC